MSGGTEFSAERPKGDAWGIEDAVSAAVAEFEATGQSPMIPCIAVIGIKGVRLTPGDNGPTRTPIVQIRRIDALTSTKAIREGQKLIMKAIEDRKGGDGAAMLPFEEKEILEMAFGGVNLDQIEQDEREAKLDEGMTDPDRLRQHLVAVHKLEHAEVEGWEFADVRLRHDSDHDALDAGEQTGLPPHDREWWAWRRVDLEAAEAESDGMPTDDADQPDDDAQDPDTAADEGADEGAAVTPLFRAADGDQED
jgi:hypothetical protein